MRWVKNHSPHYLYNKITIKYKWQKILKSMTYKVALVITQMQ